MTDLVEIASAQLRVKINPLGAELWSLTDAADREYMTDADPAFWTGHAPILFPIIGMLNGGRYRLDGRSYDLPKHGFARHSAFEVVERVQDRTHLRLRDSEETRAVYPFAFALDIRFRVDAATLHVEARVTNAGDAVMPFSFGFHPAFAWPLPGGAAKADHRLRFAQPEPEDIRRIDPASGLLLPDRFATPIEGAELRPDASLFEADALIWDAPVSRSTTFGAPEGSSVTVAFPDMPMLGVWQKPGAAYLCIEPWQGIADPVDFAGDLRDKPGVFLLPPEESHLMRMDVTITPESSS